MAVRVRLFAALRDAAGTGEALVSAGPLPAVLDDLRARHGARFAAVLGMSSVLVDGTPVPRDATVEVPDGAELALLPPASGGATDPRALRREDLWGGPAPPPGEEPRETPEGTAPLPTEERSSGPRPLAEEPRDRADGTGPLPGAEGWDGSRRSAEAQGGREGTAPLPALAGGGDAVTADVGGHAPQVEPFRLSRGVVVGAGVFVAGVLGALVGVIGFGVVVLVLAAWVVGDLVVLLDRGVARPVVPVVGAVGLGVPVLVLVGVRAAGTLASATVALTVAAAFAWLIVARRRFGVADTLGATLLVALLVGLGGGGLLLLRTLPDGLLLVLLVVLLAVAVDVGTAVARVAGFPPGWRLVAGLGAPVVVGALLLLVPRGPSALTAALVWLATVAGTLLGTALTARLRAEAGGAARRAVGDGLILSAVDAVLLSAPLAYLVVRAAG